MIVCLVYNHESYLKDALEGFVMQKTDFPFVAIIHDDASTDGSSKIIGEYAKKYPDIILPIYEEENQWSRHDGSLGKIIDSARKATGASFVALCEGDDYWTDQFKLQKQVDILKNNKDISLVHTDYLPVDEKGHPLDYPPHRLHQRKSRSGSFFYNLLQSNYILTLTVAIRSELFDSPFFIDSIPKMDYLLFLVAAAHGKSFYIPEKTGCYRIVHNGQLQRRLVSVINRSNAIKEYILNKFIQGDIKNITIIERISVYRMVFNYILQGKLNCRLNFKQRNIYFPIFRFLKKIKTGKIL